MPSGRESRTRVSRLRPRTLHPGRRRRLGANGERAVHVLARGNDWRLPEHFSSEWEPDLDYNNFGATIGGPLLKSKEKLFFFFSEELRRISRAPASLTALVPNPEWLTDPTSANYVAPAERDPIAVRLLSGYPAPPFRSMSRPSCLPPRCCRWTTTC